VRGHGKQGLHFKALKLETHRLCSDVEEGVVGEAPAIQRFTSRLRHHFQTAAADWAAQVANLEASVRMLFSMASASLCGDVCHGISQHGCQPLSLRLLEPLSSWLEMAAWTDSLRRERLSLLRSLARHEQIFAKGLQISSGHIARQIFEESPLAELALHNIAAQLEAAGDTLLRLGLGSPEDEHTSSSRCPLCCCTLIDPIRLPCGHRCCVHCLLPALSSRLCSGMTAKAEPQLACLWCPTCGAAGPTSIEDFSFDSVLARFERGLRAGASFPSMASTPRLKVCSPKLSSWMASALLRLRRADLRRNGEEQELLQKLRPAGHATLLRDDSRVADDDTEQSSYHQNSIKMCSGTFEPAIAEKGAATCISLDLSDSESEASTMDAETSLLSTSSSCMSVRWSSHLL